MGDNPVGEGSSAGEEDGLSSVGLTYVETAYMNGDSVDQVDFTQPTKGNVLVPFNSEPNDTRLAEDGARDDMFVDCPDEIETSESQNSEEKDNLPDDHLNESDSGIKLQHLMDEMELLRDNFEKSVAEKQIYEAERAGFMRELADLCSQLKVLNQQQISPGENTDGVNHQTVASLHEMTSECCRLVHNALNERYQADENFKGLYSALHMKDQEIDFLNAKVAKGDSLYQTVSHLEDENKRLLEQLEKQGSIVENANTEIRRLSAEVEQERNRYANTKEKLSMAVTKGKALVQQRDQLKQSLAEKTSQLEKCSIELQEKSSALEAAERTKESLAEKDVILQNCEEILSEVVEVEELQPKDITEKLRWLADENRSLVDVSRQFDKLTDALLLFDFPESLASSEPDTRVCWLAESFYLSKEEIAKTREAASREIDHLTTSLLAEEQEKSKLLEKLEGLTGRYEAHERLQHELAEMKEAANDEIDRLTKSLLEESQEKNYLQAELEGMRLEYEEIVRKESQLSLEKDKIVNLLLEASGHPDNSLEDFHVDDCLAEIKEQSCRVHSSQFEVEMFGSFQSLLYITDLEMRLCKLIVEEDIMDRGEVNHLSDELVAVTQELNAVKEEKAVLQKSIEQLVSDELAAVNQELNTVKEEKAVMEKSIEQLDDRCTLLKEKLSMAVKKGKGLVQDRENLKGSLNVKNTEIEKLQSELQRNVSAYDECQDKITKFCLEVERISQLETDLIATKERADQLEQFLAESNTMVQRIMESIEDITTPDGLVFEEPEEKVKWLARYLSEHYEMEEELRIVKAEANSLAGKFSELFDEKKELELSKKVLEEELGKEKEEASSLTSRFEEVSSALSLAENNISRIMNERDLAEESGALAQEQLQKLKKEFSSHIDKLVDAGKNIRSLEDLLSQAEKNVSLLAEENNKLQIVSADLENEMKKNREEADSQASKLSDASLTIKSLEDKLSNAENNMAGLTQEKKNAEQEIFELNFKLKSCMEELAGTHGSIENRSLELSGQLSQLQLLLKNDSLSSSIDQCFREKVESLNKMNFLLKEMNGFFLEIDSDVMQKSPVMEDDSSFSTTLPSIPGSALNMEMSNGEMNALDSESVVLHIEKMNASFHQKGKTLSAKLDSFSALMDESVAALFRKLHLTKDGILSMMKSIKSLKEQVNDMETDKQRQEDSIASLEYDIEFLLSACTDATQHLELNVHRNISELRSIHEMVKLDDRILTDLAAVGGDAAAGPSGDHVKMAEKLLLVTGHNQDLSELNREVINKLLSITEDVRNKLQEAEETCGEISEERDLLKESISKLETDLDEQQKLCQQMTVELDDYREKEDDYRTKEEELRKIEEELSTALSKVHELEGNPLSASQVKSILMKINKVEVPDTFGVVEPHDSADVRKLFYMIDSFSESLQKISFLSHEKEELQSTIEKLILESQLMKKKVEDHMVKEKESGKMLTNLLELESCLQNIVRKLGGNDLIDSQKAGGGIFVLPLLEKLVTATMVESENLKSKNEELGTKLLGSQKAVDELSNKVKLLEDSKLARIVPTETVEREITLPSLSTQSEISEIQDLTSVGTSSSIPLVQSAAHVRTMRKGSSDHLAISIDSESERLINTKDLDEDKGHAFKSLNTTGFIPRQGRAFADRVDGIWVSGSRALMSHPRGRLSLIVYWLVLHIWLLGSIL